MMDFIDDLFDDMPSIPLPVPHGQLELDLIAMVATEDVGDESDYQMARHLLPARQRELRTA